MTTLITTLAAALVGGALLTTAAAQTASAQPAVSAFLPVANEPPPKLIVESPIPHRLAAGAVLIPYRTENFRILPVFGPGALDVSPRAGHLHVTVDDLPWHWADASDDQTVVVVGLRELVPAARVVVFTAHGDHHGVQAALDAGAHGALLKDAAATDLAAALRRAGKAHGEHEARTGGAYDVNWPDWYAAYIAAEQSGAPLPL